MHWIQKTLHTAGLRNSKTRNQIIEQISNGCEMFQAADIITALPDVDRVTVYRTLDTLSELDIIHPTLVRDGAQYYELHTPESHHHHAMCDGCHNQQCIDCDVTPKPGMHHTVFYSFTCVSCA